MSTAVDKQVPPWPIRAVAVIATLTIAICASSMVLSVIGTRYMTITDQSVGVTAEMSVRGNLVDDVDLSDLLPSRIVDDDGTVTSGGQARVDITGPTNVAALMFDPTPSQRIIWLMPRLLGPVLVAAVAWSVRAMAGSARDGDPFTMANERRLWRIATLIAAGGTFMTVIDGVTNTLLVQRSAAADLFTVSFDFSFAQIVAGLVIAALASVWRVGIALRDEAAATI